MSELDNKQKHQYADSGEASRIYLLPNSLTAGNLFFGFLAIMQCIEANYATDPTIINGHFTQAVWFIFFGVVCDAFDGRVARMGGRESLFGIEFDSIADVISFGVAPAMMMIFLILKPDEQYEGVLHVSQLIGFTYLLCAAVRLARFNVLTHPMLPPAERLKDTKDFLGLPVPAAAGMVASLVLVYTSFEKYGYEMHGFELIMPPLMLAIAGLMISNVPYPSFKDIDWQTSTRFRTFIFLVLGLGVAFVIKELAFAVLFFAYIAFGPIRYFYRVYRARKRLNKSSSKPSE
ncbi:MAG: CDP-diacylglycerol--serine O-phosphatidyltransferase [Opitutaceae bacterium]